MIFNSNEKTVLLYGCETWRTTDEPAEDTDFKLHYLALCLAQLDVSCWDWLKCPSFAPIVLYGGVSKLISNYQAKTMFPIKNRREILATVIEDLQQT
mgnify:CR=1 FL=1